MLGIILGFIAILIFILTGRTMYLSWKLARKKIEAENVQLEKVVTPIVKKKKEKSNV